MASNLCVEVYVTFAGCLYCASVAQFDDDGMAEWTVGGEKLLVRAHVPGCARVHHHPSAGMAFFFMCSHERCWRVVGGGLAICRLLCCRTWSCLPSCLQFFDSFGFAPALILRVALIVAIRAGDAVALGRQLLEFCLPRPGLRWAFERDGPADSAEWSDLTSCSTDIRLLSSSV